MRVIIYNDIIIIFDVTYGIYSETIILLFYSILRG